MGQFMWGVLSNYLNLRSTDILAMTTINFTSATDPKNPNSVYHGASSFTRCVWEIRLGNVVSENNILIYLEVDFFLIARNQLTAGPLRR